MQPNATDLTPQQQQAIELFTRGMTVRCIAEAVGVSRETLWRWRQHEHFNNAVYEAKRQQYEQIRDQAQSLLGLSMASLARVLEDPEARVNHSATNTAFKVLDFIVKTGLLSEGHAAE